jgi:hypothetical protein
MLLIFMIFGAPHSKVVELMVEIEEFPIIWKRQPLDLEKLAYFHHKEQNRSSRLTVDGTESRLI